MVHGSGGSHALIVAPGSFPYKFDTSCKSLGYVLMGSCFLLVLVAEVLGQFGTLDLLRDLGMENIHVPNEFSSEMMAFYLFYGGGNIKGATKLNRS